MPSAVQQHFDNFRKELNKRLHTENAVTNLLAKIEKKTGIDRSFMVVDVVGLLALCLIFGLVCNLIGFAYSAFASIRAIESHTKEDEKRWLIGCGIFTMQMENAVTNLLAKIEAKTGIDRSFMILGIVGYYLTFGYNVEFVCKLIGYAYPVYASICAIESYTEEDYTQWLTYWVIFALFRVVDEMFAWSPLYWIVKCGIVLYLYMPFTRGAQQLYENGIRPFFKRNKETMDKLFGKFSDKVKDAAKDVLNNVDYNKEN